MYELGKLFSLYYFGENKEQGFDSVIDEYDDDEDEEDDDDEDEEDDDDEDDDEDDDIPCPPGRVKQDLVDENKNSDKGRIKRFELLFDDKYQTIRFFDKYYDLVTNKKEKNIILKLPLKEVLMDTYCKRMIKHQVEICRYNHKIKGATSKQERYVTPYELYQDGCISTGRYSDWKRFIPESIIAEALGIEREYGVDINDVLSETILVLIVLMYIIEDTDVDERYYLYDELILADKVITLYNSGTKTCSLTKDEESLIKFRLDDENWYYEKEERFIEDNKELMYHIKELDSVNPIDIDGKLIDKKLIDKKLKDQKLIDKKLIDKKNEVLTTLKGTRNGFKKDIEVVTKPIGSQNTDDDIYEFSAFLAPIIASVAETHHKNPFLCESAWKEKIPCYVGTKYKISDTTMKNFSLLIYFLEYENREDGNKELNDYECMVYEASYKVSELSIKNCDKCFQYYEVESLYGALFVDKVVEILNKRLPEFKSYAEISDQLEWLSEDLKEIYDFEPITRIALAQNILERLMFDAKQFSLQELKMRRYWLPDDVIDNLKEMARVREMLLLEEWQQVGFDGKKVSGLNPLWGEKRIRGDLMEFFEAYDSWAGEVKNDATCESDKSKVTHKRIEMMVAEKAKTESQRRRDLKKWVTEKVLKYRSYSDLHIQ